MHLIFFPSFFSLKILSKTRKPELYFIIFLLNSLYLEIMMKTEVKK